jgi:hypothetical protein
MSQDMTASAAIALALVIFVLGPLAIATGVIAIRRATRKTIEPQVPKVVSDRLDRIEQGIEAIAVEVERIGEGQRFVTQLLGERAQSAKLSEGIPRT